ncbi:unnamed protein product [Miscanthus lutarioriparius]|uniref:Uncharacterized protein n=1 Tax=Miscanthus lutarioriparius TaxID=422564 RepID=A0A811SD51_9POAL|nr:unnamed protein product [Miscanthus lutarioriparius]
MLKPAASIAVVALAVMLSSTQRLGVEGETLYAVARSFVQLLLIGFVLHFIFVQKNATPSILLTYLFMVTVASYTAGKRAKQVETALALGATPRQATLQQIRTSQEIALSPGIDNAKTQGVINLPGAMTGLIMAGASPLEAIQVQIVLKNMLMAASTFSSIVSSFLCWPAFFTKTFQLKEEVFAD